MAKHLAPALAALALLALPSAATAGANARSCGRTTLSSTHFKIVIRRGPVSCGEAKTVMRLFLSGGGVKHGSGAEYKLTWTVDGWTCGHGAGGGACIRGGPSYLNARDYIEGSSA